MPPSAFAPTTARACWGRAVIYCQQCGSLSTEREVDGRTRPVCDGCGAVTYLDPKLAVAVVIERAGRVLFGRRAAGTRGAGKWGLPAGFVERGEPVEETAMREVREEVGLTVELGPLLGLYSEAGETVVLAVYSALVAHGEPVAQDGLDEVGWFPPDVLPDLAFPHDASILDAWRAKRIEDRRMVGAGLALPDGLIAEG